MKSHNVTQDVSNLTGKAKRNTFTTIVMLQWRHMGAGCFGNVSDKPVSSLFRTDTLNTEPSGSL